MNSQASAGQCRHHR